MTWFENDCMDIHCSHIVVFERTGERKIDMDATRSMLRNKLKTIGETVERVLEGKKEINMYLTRNHVILERSVEGAYRSNLGIKVGLEA